MKELSTILQSKTAFLTVDMQNDFLHLEGGYAKRGNSPVALQRMLPNLVNFLGEIRKASNIKIIHTIMEEDEWSTPKCWQNAPAPLLAKGTWGAEFYGINPLNSELVLPKYWYGAFSGSMIHAILQNLGIQTLIIAGVLTNVCVETTAREAFQHNYNPIVLSDCTAAYSQDEHLIALQNIRRYFGNVASSDEIFQALQDISNRTTSIQEKKY